VREALREYGRTVAIFAAAGLVLSLLVGILAGNPFGVILLRALAFAAAFGGVGAGLQYVVRRFLPELAGGTDATPPGPPETAGATGSTVDIVLPEEPVSYDDAATPAEPVEDLPAAGEEAPTGGADPAASGSPAGAGAPGGDPGPGEDVDALPEMASVDDVPSGPRPAPSPYGRPRPADATRDVLERMDRATLARGVHTMLKRDERP
jgi:hypothetical protein